MQTLTFCVERDRIKKHSTFDGDTLYLDPKEPIQIRFIFSPDWDEYPLKVVGFYNRKREELTPQVLLDENTCVLPVEALDDGIFYIKILGQNVHGTRSTQMNAFAWMGR